MLARRAEKTTTGDAAAARVERLRAHIEQARAAMFAKAARLRLLAADPDADLDELADAAVATGIEGARFAAFARQLKRVL